MKVLGLILSWFVLLWHYYHPNIFTWCLIGFFVGYGSTALEKDINELLDL